MSPLEDYLSGATCAICGSGVGLNEEGRVVCEGCNIAIDNCTCERQAAASR
jgi:uncharacterized membrane protein